MLVAHDSMGQTPGGILTRIAADGARIILPVVAESPFTAQISAFAAMLAGAPHPFDLARDLAAFRLLDAAYTEAKRCL